MKKIVNLTVILIYDIDMDEDLPKAVALLQDVREKSKDVLTHIEALVKKAQDGEFKTSKVSNS